MPDSSPMHPPEKSFASALFCLIYTPSVSRYQLILMSGLYFWAISDLTMLSNDYQLVFCPSAKGSIILVACNLSYHHGTEIAFREPPSLPSVPGDRREIESVLWAALSHCVLRPHFEASPRSLLLHWFLRLRIAGETWNQTVHREGGCWPYQNMKKLGWFDAGSKMRSVPYRMHIAQCI